MSVCTEMCKNLKKKLRKGTFCSSHEFELVWGYVVEATNINKVIFSSNFPMDTINQLRKVRRKKFEKIY